MAMGKWGRAALGFVNIYFILTIIVQTEVKKISYIENKQYRIRIE